MYEKLNYDPQFMRRITDLLGTKFKIGNGGKLVPRDPAGSRASPWIFISYDIRKKFCAYWHGVYCVHYNLMPTKCRINCWKTVVKPRTVKELFACYQIFKQLDLPSKIGMDVRDYTYGAWAGFIYGDSLSQGCKYYKIARSTIAKDIPIILKRGCTEMERLKPSNTWDEITAQDIETEQRLNDLFDFNEEHFYQAGWLKAEIKQRWIKRAIEIGDPTAKEVAEREFDDPDIWQKLVVHSVQYQNQENQK